MKSLGLSPTEQEVVDMQCEVEKKGRIFFPDFCKLCLRKFREFDEENFRQIMFKVKAYGDIFKFSLTEKNCKEKATPCSGENRMLMGISIPSRTDSYPAYPFRRSSFSS